MAGVSQQGVPQSAPRAVNASSLVLPTINGKSITAKLDELINLYIPQVNMQTDITKLKDFRKTIAKVIPGYQEFISVFDVVHGAGAGPLAYLLMKEVTSLVFALCVGTRDFTSANTLVMFEELVFSVRQLPKLAPVSQSDMSDQALLELASFFNQFITWHTEAKSKITQRLTESGQSVAKMAMLLTDMSNVIGRDVKVLGDSTQSGFNKIAAELTDINSIDGDSITLSEFVPYHTRLVSALIDTISVDVSAGTAMLKAVTTAADSGSFLKPSTVGSNQKSLSSIKDILTTPYCKFNMEIMLDLCMIHLFVPPELLVYAKRHMSNVLNIVDDSVKAELVSGAIMLSTSGTDTDATARHSALVNTWLSVNGRTCFRHMDDQWGSHAELKNCLKNMMSWYFAGPSRTNVTEDMEVLQYALDEKLTKSSLVNAMNFVSDILGYDPKSMVAYDLSRRLPEVKRAIMPLVRTVSEVAKQNTVNYDATDIPGSVSTYLTVLTRLAAEAADTLRNVPQTSTDIATLNQTIIELKDELKAAANEKKDLEAEMDELSRTIKKKNKQTDTAAGNVRKLNQQLTVAQTNLEKARRELGTALHTNNLLQQNNETLTFTLTESTAEIDRLKLEIERLDNEAETYKSEMDDLRESLATATDVGRYNTAVRNLKTVTDANALLTADLDNLRIDLAATQAGYEQYRNSIQFTMRHLELSLTDREIPPDSDNIPSSFFDIYTKLSELLTDYNKVKRELNEYINMGVSGRKDADMWTKFSSAAKRNHSWDDHDLKMFVRLFSEKRDISLRQLTEFMSEAPLGLVPLANDASMSSYNSDFSSSSAEAEAQVYAPTNKIAKVPFFILGEGANQNDDISLVYAGNNALEACVFLYGMPTCNEASVLVPFSDIDNRCHCYIFTLMSMVTRTELVVVWPNGSVEIFSAELARDQVTYVLYYDPGESVYYRAVGYSSIPDFSRFGVRPINGQTTFEDLSPELRTALSASGLKVANVTHGSDVGAQEWELNWRNVLGAMQIGPVPNGSLTCTNRECLCDCIGTMIFESGGSGNCALNIKDSDGSHPETYMVPGVSGSAMMIKSQHDWMPALPEGTDLSWLNSNAGQGPLVTTDPAYKMVEIPIYVVMERDARPSYNSAAAAANVLMPRKRRPHSSVIQLQKPGRTQPQTTNDISTFLL